ncbi:hypothetical protein [Pseudomonas sp. ML2-2023-6]|uniref:hypothetical protein n=1 Tax=Pseudomonas sp. ML2-2023-6 TaxID=3122376 RepID=UPI0030D22EA7
MSEIDFKQALADAGIPTTKAKLRQAWEAEVAAQGSKLSNSSGWASLSASTTAYCPPTFQ